MSRPQRPWFRFYVEAIDDDKVMRHGLAALGLWTVLMALARKSPVTGFLMISEGTAHTYRTIAGKARSSESSVKKLMGEFERDFMITFDQEVRAWRLVNWTARQYESDNSAERTSQWRANGRHNKRHSDETVTSPEAEAELQIQSSSSATVTHDPPAERPAAAADSLIEQALNLLADRRVAGNGQVKNPAGYRRAVLDGLRHDHAAALKGWWGDPKEPYSTWTPQQLADWLEPAPVTPNSYSHYPDWTSR